MSLLTFDNPVFRYYAVAAALMIVKMMSQHQARKARGRHPSKDHEGHGAQPE